MINPASPARFRCMPAQRWEHYQTYVRASRRSAWVYVHDSTGDQHFRASLTGQGIAFRAVLTNDPVWAQRPAGYASSGPPA